MKLTTPGSGDSPRDLSRPPTVVPCQGKRHRCQEPWHRRPGPAVGTDGVNSVTRHDGSDTTHGREEPAPDATGARCRSAWHTDARSVPGTWHCSTARVPTFPGTGQRCPDGAVSGAGGVGGSW